MVQRLIYRPNRKSYIDNYIRLDQIYMGKPFFIFFLLLLNYFSFGQSKTSFPGTELDSLWSIWQDETQADTTRLSALGSYSWYGYVFTQPDSAFYYADILYDSAKKIGSKKHISYALGTKGTSFWVKGDFARALDFNKQSLAVAEDWGGKKMIAGALSKVGIVYGELGDAIKQIEYFEKSLKIREEVGNKSAIAFSLSHIGELYRAQGNFTKALEYQSKCLRLREEVGKEADIAFTLNNIGLIHLDQGNYPTALRYHQQSLELGEEFSDKKDMASYLSNIGTSFKKMANFADALDYYQRSMQLLEDIGALSDISELLTEIGELYFIQKKYLNGIDYCKKAHSIALDLGSIRKQKNACQCLYDNYKGVNNATKALEYHEKMLALNDSLKSEETGRKLQQMEFAKTMFADSLAKVEKDRMIEAGHQEELRKKNQTRNISITIGVFILLLAAILYNRLKFVRKSKATLQVEKNRSENLLLNILPKEIAQELKDKGKAEARDFDMVSILFTDFKSFTQASEKLSAQELVKEINSCFEAFDGIIEKYGIEKIKTIGDAYMAAGGLPVPSKESVKNTVLAALEMQAIHILIEFKAKRAKDEVPFEMRSRHPYRPCRSWYRWGQEISIRYLG